MRRELSLLTTPRFRFSWFRPTKSWLSLARLLHW
nr:MAG TPA: hypothetical protein [Bacteriophage sp.]